MALRKQISFSGVSTIKTDLGVLTQKNTSVTLNAYIKIEEVKSSKSDAVAIISMTDGDAKIVISTPFIPSVKDNSKNIIAQAYDAIKQMPMFANAEDC
jgi:hypothetical protein